MNSHRTIPGETVVHEDGRLLIRKEIAAPRITVWRCLTEPECLKGWWRENIRFEAREGGRFVEPWIDPTGRDRTVNARVTSFQPYEGFVMVWADDDWTFDTVVAVSLDDMGDRTRVTIEHQGWERAPEPDRSTLLLHHHDGWNRHMDNLAGFAETFDSGSRRSH